VIHGFPIPYPDEAFYSVVARRMARFEGKSHKGLLRQLFGTTNVIATVEFPGRLAWLAQELNQSHPCANLDDLVAKHTLLPWYQPFLPPERATKIKEGMLQGDSKGAWGTAGIMAGRVKVQEFLRYCPECFREDIQNNRSLHYLERTGCHTAGTDNWLTKIVRKPDGMRAPIKHLVLLTALGGAIADLASDPPAQETEPKKTCDNPLCPQKGQSEVVMIGQKYSGELKALTSKWRCEACGRTWNVCKAGIKKSWIKDFGYVWNAKLTELWLDPTVTLVGLASVLGVDPMTIKKHAWKEKLPFPRAAKRATTTVGIKMPIASTEGQRDVENLKKQWLEKTAKHPGVGTKQLRAENGGLYANLYKYDRSWLREHSPRAPVAKQRSRQTNWADRDAKLAERIKQEADQLREITPPTFISRLALARAAKCEAWTQHKAELLPKTIAAMENLAETRVDFACRRIAHAIAEIKEAGQPIKFWEVRARAGLRPKWLLEPRIAEALKGTVNKPRNRGARQRP
jgi:DNA-directed RNA polymerase subunit M/transcription elongation factor TFIIS